MVKTQLSDLGRVLVPERFSWDGCTAVREKLLDWVKSPRRQERGKNNREQRTGSHAG